MDRKLLDEKFVKKNCIYMHMDYKATKYNGWTATM